MRLYNSFCFNNSNIAVTNIICAFVYTNFPNFAISRRKLDCQFNITQYLLITIQSILRQLRFINNWNVLLAAASSVINIIVALLTCLSFFYSQVIIFNFSYNQIIFCYNSVNNTITIVILLSVINIDNWNIKLLPLPVNIIITICKRPCIIALITLFCILRNCVSFFNIQRNSCLILTERNNTFRA